MSSFPASASSTTSRVSGDGCPPISRWAETPTAPGGLEVELVTRDGCHLCDLALAMLRSEAERRPLRIVLRDVDADPELLSRYDLRVPVVRSRGRELCEGMIMPLQLRAALDEAAAGG